MEHLLLSGKRNARKFGGGEYIAYYHKKESFA